MCLIAHIGSLFQPPGPKRRFLGPNPIQRGPILVGSSFDQNIGMWGVQIVATEFSDGFRQLQLILNHPAGETIQKRHFGAFKRPKMPFRVPGGPEEAPYQAKVCANHNSSQVRPIDNSWDQSWPLWCAQKLFSQLGSV